MNRLNWKQLQWPVIALSPMADMTDSAFCRVVREVMKSWSHGVMECPSPLHHSTTPPLIVFREMVSAEAVLRENDKTLNMTKIHEDERPIVQQIFGSDPKVMARAASIIEKTSKPEGIDINMGCPVYKMVHSFNGAALMKDEALAMSIVQAVKGAVSVPVSIKIRTGWDDPNLCFTFGKALENAGADMITIHGRTKIQGYGGISDWDIIKYFKETVTIPVLANGDIFTPQLALQAIKHTACDGVMIARGALGNPWIFSQIKTLLSGGELQPISLKTRIEIVITHANFHIEEYGEESLKTFRKHLTWYFKGIPEAKKYKERLHTIINLENLISILKEISNDETEDESISRRDGAHPLAGVRMHLSK